MFRAFNLAANEPAVGQIGRSVGANGAKGAQLGANAGEQNGLAVHFDFVQGVGGNGSGRDIYRKKAIFIGFGAQKGKHGHKNS